MAEDSPALQLSGTPSCVLELNPWKIAEKVIELWGSNLDLFDSNSSFPVPTVSETSCGLITHAPGYSVIGIT